MNDVYVHSLDPVIFHIYGSLAVRWYGLAYLLGFVCAYFLMKWLIARQGQNVTQEMLGDLVTYGAFGVLIGGRLGYAIFYSPDLFIKFRSDFPFWGLLAVNEGGMASHGGMIGLVVGCWLFARKHKVNLLYVFDLVAVSGPIGIFFGRIANFINGELVGREAPPGLPWAVKFPTDIEFWPSQAPEKLRDLAQVVSKLPGWTAEKWQEVVENMGRSFEARQMVYEALHQIVIGCQKGQQDLIQGIAPYLVARHPSQIYQALLEGLLLFLVLFFLWAKDRKPGLIGAYFVIFYALARIIGEQFRMPDAHIGYQWLNLTRGQWLSIGMLVVGVVLWALWRRQMGGEIHGWFRVKSIHVRRKYR
ncbi:MAG: prolipoprotein diacylglyceryl transferase [Bdellovibrionaceae bacterium]|nr:prolipoprotein diacylglyceryl transferase [Pseudobdellovibrionaceae bacterium]MDW8190316.1 prolipoprotein diacylglyceryl transferase [Pseudobdellovibrionaceae bacterium]